MLPNVYQLIRQNSTVVSTVGTRIYRHGSAPQNVQKPYVTWFLVSGNPYDNVSQSPSADRDLVQIDCWSETDEQVETLAYAIRSALYSNLITNRMVINSRENDTKLYRSAIEADFIASR